jgi:hypothetical protein
MKSITYIPGTDADKGVWLANFSTKLPLYASALGLSPAEVTSVQDDNAFFQYVVAMTEAYKQTMSNLVSFKNQLKHAIGTTHIGALPTLPSLAVAPTGVPEGIFDRVSKLATRIKNSLAYSTNMGADLGIVTPLSAAINVAALQPELKLRLDVGRPRIKWVKGITDAIDLYADRNDTNGFVLIGRLVKNEYIDVTSLGTGKVFDEWKYKAIYVIADEQVGLFSIVMPIDVKKM